LRYISPDLTFLFVTVLQFVEIDVIFNNTFDVLEENSTIYIATDERNRTFFNLLQEHYKIYFMDDFKDLLEGVNTNYYGMVDQLIVSRGRTFIGTYYSTFTGYINRIRGYHSQKDKAEGYELGVINSYFDIPLAKKYDMREYRTFKPPWWWFAREYPIGWRDLDKGIGAN
jgi:GDP-fucose protein O-fucosyltransferase